ncbi:hypothetical protein OESDEN_07794 [Oesophagostomum dentatum]|uniref:Uncharacterized protein n=1 Tax=Oesophagostomum dentatum TaxID=61180 RepID=A0A0B1TAB2_OESDE|nr:hypothetical protein OESDEN_07794 [Oesophagostomum dentatum]
MAWNGSFFKAVVHVDNFVAKNFNARIGMAEEPQCTIGSGSDHRLLLEEVRFNQMLERSATAEEEERCCI